MTKGLDLYDKKILHELDLNARQTSSAISKTVKLPKETVNYRIKRFKKKGFIKYFYTLINASKLGYNHYKIFLKFQRITREKEKKIIKYLVKNRHCTNLRLTEGYYEFVFITVQKSPKDLRKFLQNFNSRFGKDLLEKDIHTITTTYKLNQKIVSDERRSRIYFHHEGCTEKKFDDTDLKILKVIGRDARIKLVNLGREVGENSRVIRYHLKKLEKLGVIVGYSAELNLKKFNKNLVQIDISLTDLNQIPTVIEFFDRTNTCVFAYELLGKYDVSIEVYIESDIELRKMMKDFKERFIDDYINFDISRVYQEHTINWSPFKTKFRKNLGKG